MRKLLAWPRGYKTIFMLNLVRHGLFFAYEYENANNMYELRKKFMPAIFSKKEFAIVSNLRFISRTNSMLSWVEHNVYY